MPQLPERYVELVTGGEVVSGANPIPTSGGGGGGGGAVTVADGADVTQGAIADPAVSTDASGTVSAKLRGIIVNLVALLARLPAALTGSGNFKVSISETIAVPVTDNGGSLTVDGTVNVGTSGLPTGAATEATLLTRTKPADSQIVRASPLTWVDGSGTIASGGVAQTALAANATRARLLIQNVSTGLLWINFTTAAVQSQPSVRLEPYDIWVDMGPSCTGELVSIIGATTAQAFVAKQAG